MTAHPGPAGARTPSKLLNALAQPLLTLDARGMFDVNNAAENFFDMGRGALLRSRLADLMPFGLAGARPGRRGAQQSRDRQRLQARHHHAAHRHRDVSTPSSRLCRKPTAWHYAARTVNCRKNGQATDPSQRRAIGHRARRMLAHEIKNPLSGIRGAAQLLEADERRGSRPDAADLRGDRPHRQTGRSDGVVLRRRRRSARASTFTRCSITSSASRRRALRAISALSRSTIRRCRTCCGSRDQLIQVFLNLVKNAAEAIGDESIDGEIILTTAYRPGVRLRSAPSAEPVGLPLEICVRDNGPGLRREIVGNLFDPFVTTKSQGSGLGLALVAKLIGDHGGVIECEFASAPDDVSRADAAATSQRAAAR